MMERRSASQILFGFLPEQTVDVKGHVWRVTKWRYPNDERNVDTEALRRELCRLATPWQLNGRDDGFVQELQQRRASVKVKTLDRDKGVELEPFPKIWMCKRCNRLHDTVDARCPCGSTARKGSFHFVGYCDQCAELREPYIRRCQQHNEVKVIYPGTASGREIRFACPTCNQETQRGFGFPRCRCGAALTITVHRAAAVYTPRSVVIVNPPSRERMRQIEDAGGAARALTWVLDGMQSSMLEGKPDASALRKQLLSQGLPEDVVERMLAAAQDANAMGTAAVTSVPMGITEEAETQAITIALAMSESRTTIQDLATHVDPLSESGVMYREKYAHAMEQAGIARVELIEKFPILTGHYGFTRGSHVPGESRLKAFRERAGDYIVYGDLAETEALFIQLSPMRVAEWMRVRGFALPDWSDARSAHLAILTACAADPDHTKTALMTMVHSYAHRLIRLTAVHAGIERNALSELLVPLHLGFFVYAAARGDFVLGGLQAVFEGELHHLLQDLVHGEHRCALDPGCTRGGGACVACLHLGEPSCRHFNMHLDRSTIGGRQGYLTMNRTSTIPIGG